jgi:predicted nicotinamide N-methyase
MSRLCGFPATPAYREDKHSEDVLYTEIASRYHLANTDLMIAGIAFRILRVSDTNALLETIDPETFALDERLPYWAELWTSAIVLAEWCIQSGAVCRKDVLEIGCGLGLPGIAAARAGARVVMTDYDQDALRFARYNALVNVPETMPTFNLMDWRAADYEGRFDFLLGSDIIYEQRNFLPLLYAFSRLLRPRGTVVLTDPDRNISTTFLGLAREQGYSIQSSRCSFVYADRPVNVTRYELKTPSAVLSKRGECS